MLPRLEPGHRRLLHLFRKPRKPFDLSFWWSRRGPRGFPNASTDVVPNRCGCSKPWDQRIYERGRLCCGGVGFADSFQLQRVGVPGMARGAIVRAATGAVRHVLRSRSMHRARVRGRVHARCPAGMRRRATRREPAIWERWGCVCRRLEHGPTADDNCFYPWLW